MKSMNLMYRLSHNPRKLSVISRASITSDLRARHQDSVEMVAEKLRLAEWILGVNEERHGSLEVIMICIVQIGDSKLDNVDP